MLRFPTLFSSFVLASLSLALGCTGKSDDTGSTNDSVDDSVDDSGNDTQDTAVDDTGSPASDTLGFATSVAFTEPLVIVPAAAYWDSVPDPSAGICTLTPGADGYLGTCVPDGSLLAADPTWSNSITGNFVAFAFGDTNADGSFSADESLVAMSRYQLVYVAGEPAADAATAGLTTGWNAIDLHAYDQTGVLSSVAPTSIPLARNLEAAMSVSLGGSVDMPYNASTRLVVLFSTSTGDAQVDQGPVTDPWQVVMSGEPDGAWTSEIVPDVSRGEGWVAAYEDNDADDTYDDGDAFVGVPRDDDGNGIDVVWLTPTAHDPSMTMRLMLTLGVDQFGWAAWNMNGAPLPADTDAITLSAM